METVCYNTINAMNEKVSKKSPCREKASQAESAFMRLFCPSSLGSCVAEAAVGNAVRRALSVIESACMRFYLPNIFHYKVKLL